MKHLHKSLNLFFFIFAVAASPSLAQDEPHPWCNTLIVMHDGSERSKEVLDSVISRLDNRFDIKGFHINKPADSASLVELVADNKVDFGVVLKAEAQKNDRVRILSFGSSEQNAVIASPRFYEMGYTYRELIIDAALVEDFSAAKE